MPNQLLRILLSILEDDRDAAGPSEPGQLRVIRVGRLVHRGRQHQPPGRAPNATVVYPQAWPELRGCPARRSTRVGQHQRLGSIPRYQQLESNSSPLRKHRARPRATRAPEPLETAVHHDLFHYSSPPLLLAKTMRISPCSVTPPRVPATISQPMKSSALLLSRPGR